ncbi:MAG: DUF4032 domain-containing protein [Acidobacteria bacterium]|nr:DUF4032 domain-containing protein [Acidobacteriota bacterium]
MPIQFRLEHVIERTGIELRGAAGARELGRIAGVRVSPKVAREVWPHILEHKWYVSERMGRDVGLRVAAVDYFENVRV